MNEYVLAAIVWLNEAVAFWPLNHLTTPAAIMLVGFAVALEHDVFIHILSF
jgi:hypothetical protein